MDEANQSTILKRDALGRVFIPEAKREELLDEFERSGLKGAQFARAAGICYQTFACWVQRRRHARGDYQPKQRTSTARSTPPLRLVEALFSTAATSAPVPPEPAMPASSPLEVLLPGGARVFVANAIQAELTAQLLKALQASC